MGYNVNSAKHYAEMALKSIEGMEAEVSGEIVARDNHIKELVRHFRIVGALTEKDDNPTIMAIDAIINNALCIHSNWEHMREHYGFSVIRPKQGQGSQMQELYERCRSKPSTGGE